MGKPKSCTKTTRRPQTLIETTTVLTLTQTAIPRQPTTHAKYNGERHEDMHNTQERHRHLPGSRPFLHWHRDATYQEQTPNADTRQHEDMLNTQERPRPLARPWPFLHKCNQRTQENQEQTPNADTRQHKDMPNTQERPRPWPNSQYRICLTRTLQTLDGRLDALGTPCNRTKGTSNV